MSEERGTVVLVHLMKPYGGVELQRNSFRTSTFDLGEWITSPPDFLPPAKDPSIHIE